MTRFPLGVFIALALLIGGCSSKPKAPALLDGPVYQNKQEGFRFLVPEGWNMMAKAEIPPGRAEKERLLVQYQRHAEQSSAILEISRADLPESIDLAAYLSEPSFSVKKWRTAQPAESVQVGGADGRRFYLISDEKRPQWAKEVTVFRRGERVYFFTVMFAPTDGASAEQVRRAVGRIVWL